MQSFIVLNQYTLYMESQSIPQYLYILILSIQDQKEDIPCTKSECAKTLEIRTCWALFMVIALCKWLLMTLLLLSYDTWCIIKEIEISAHLSKQLWCRTRCILRQVKILKELFYHSELEQLELWSPVHQNVNSF